MKQKLLRTLAGALGAATLFGFTLPTAALTYLGGNAFSAWSQVAVAGTVTLKSGNTLIVRNGGVDTRVIVDQDTRLITRVGDPLSYTAIELGDRIQAFGILVDTRTLHADTVRNMVVPYGEFEEVFTGTVSEKHGNRLTIRSGVTDIEIVLNQDTLIVDRTGLRTSFSGVEIGDRIQAFGEFKYDELRADTIVNLSISYAGLGLNAGVGAGLGFGAPLLPPTTGLALPAAPVLPTASVPALPATLGAGPLGPLGFIGGNAFSALSEIAVAGTVVLKSGNTIIVRNGGVDTRVIVDQDTRFVNRVGNFISYTAIELGDRVQAFGVLVDTRTLHADTLRNLVIPHGNFERVVTGTVSSKMGSTILIRSGIEDVEVSMNQDTLIVDRTGLRTSLSGLEIGDRVQAFGEVVNDVLFADTVVNLSVAYQTPGGAGFIPPLATGVPTVPAVPAVPAAPVPTAAQLVTMQGTLMGQGAHELYLLKEGKTYTIKVNSSSKGIESTGKAMSFAKMRNGDILIVIGSQLDSSTLQGMSLQDLSVTWK